MNIFKNTVVTLKYSLFDADDNLVEESKEPIIYLHGGYDNIFPKVESALGSMGRAAFKTVAGTARSMGIDVIG